MTSQCGLSQLFIVFSSRCHVDSSGPRRIDSWGLCNLQSDTCATFREMLPHRQEICLASVTPPEKKLPPTTGRTKLLSSTREACRL